MSKKYTFKEVQNSFHKEEPWINIFLFSKVTLPLVYLMVNYTKITPNLISILSLFLGVLSAWFYFNGQILYGASLYILSYIFDATDGKVARLTKSGKKYGAWFDIFVDRINLTLISTSISYNVFIETGSINALLLNNIFLGLAFIGFESRYNIDYFKLKNNLINSKNQKLSKYDIWRQKHKLIKEPISLPEIFLFYLIVSPLLNLEIFTLYASIIFLIIRIAKQQLFWIRTSE